MNRIDELKAELLQHIDRIDEIIQSGDYQDKSIDYYLGMRSAFIGVLASITIGKDNIK